jgi:hypothetical protein
VLQDHAQLLESKGLPAELYAALAGMGFVQAAHLPSALAVHALRYWPSKHTVVEHWTQALALL